MDLLLADMAHGSSHAILTEADPYWINQNDMFEFVGEDEFLWGSERDGFRHLYLYTLGRPRTEAADGRKLGGDESGGRGRIETTGLLFVHGGKPIGTAALFGEIEWEGSHADQPGTGHA